MFKGYEPSDEALSRFADDMVLWRDEILNSGILKKRFDYFSQYRSLLECKIPSAGFAYGIYHVKVESNGDKRFEKLFAFSKHDHYTHTSLNFVLNVYNKHHGGNIQLTLIGNTCLKYDKKDLIESSSVFRNWFSILQKFKLKFPKNKLVKHLSSSAWGHLVSTNTIIKPFDDVDPDEYSTDINDTDAQ
ncbi:hypothetical protein H257_12102 [Aphanomyces astaci]|uniref:Uncharacterized protein n=1 Tax=Aphanomyces astaci TaxID=112090 RepID=W4G1C7_APHAT|nr:hypothetical protein H257_12102 [Aphanomyces astaci]ETV73066.1 hypothetical protein H257_12102 [Aphanomyces astaci]|eukprot:XP_009837515.1 hypothetical protein H257_12102 [Aphanomyces astaci]